MVKRLIPKSFFSRDVSFTVGKPVQIENVETFDMASLKEKVDNLKAAHLATSSDSMSHSAKLKI